MSTKTPLRSKAHKQNIRKILLIVLAIITAWLLTGFAISYIFRPQIEHKLLQADCRAASTGSSRGCILKLTATNLKDTEATYDYNGIIGSSETPLIKIYSEDAFCYANTAPHDAHNFQPHETKEITLSCTGLSNPPEGNYSESSDSNPTLIVIDGYFKKETFEVTPLRD